MRSEADVERAVSRYADMVKRICLCHLKNREDTEDVFQTVFLKYLLYEGEFEGEDHEKAWFIRVSVNACKDHLKRLLRHPAAPLDLLAREPALEDSHREVLEAVLSLPEKYRDPVYLHYYEGYSALEIASILRTKANTVYSLLSRGRTMLREALGGDRVGE